MPNSATLRVSTQPQTATPKPPLTIDEAECENALSLAELQDKISRLITIYGGHTQTNVKELIVTFTRANRRLIGATTFFMDQTSRR